MANEYAYCEYRFGYDGDTLLGYVAFLEDMVDRLQAATRQHTTPPAESIATDNTHRFIVETVASRQQGAAQAIVASESQGVPDRMVIRNEGWSGSQEAKIQHFVESFPGSADAWARTQQAQEAALLRSLETQHRHLVAQEGSLSQPATIIRDARALGMVRAGERAYSIVGLSSH